MTLAADWCRYLLNSAISFVVEQLILLVAEIFFLVIWVEFVEVACNYYLLKLTSK